jgi:hypothetical protein
MEAIDEDPSVMICRTQEAIPNFKFISILSRKKSMENTLLRFCFSKPSWFHIE